MSRRERIALLERGGGCDAGGVMADEADSMGGRRERVAAAAALESEPSAPMTRRERIAMLEQQAEGRGRGEDSAGAGAADAIRREDCEMSRRERIALLEQQAEGHGGTRAETGGIGASGMRRRDDSARRRLEPAATRPQGDGGYHCEMSRRERIALLERDTAREATLGDAREVTAVGAAAQRREDSVGRRVDLSQSPGADDQLDDEAWLEQRRANRKMRLQQHTAARPLARGAAAGAVGENHATSLAERSAGGGGAVTSHAQHASGPPLAGNSSGRPPLELLEDAVGVGLDDPRWLDACNGLAAGAHKLSSGHLVRALEIMSRALSCPQMHGAAVGEGLASPLCRSAEALLACLTPQLGSLGVAVVVDALQVMAAARVQEQTYLDMLLAQLLVLMRRDRAGLAPSMLADIAGALGALHEAGLSAKRAASGASSSANRRCVEALSEQIISRLPEFGEADLAGTGAAFVVTFFDDAQRRLFLHRAADLEVGLHGGGDGQLHLAMQELERVLRKHSFAFIASLPDCTKDYLMRLKASAEQASSANRVQ